MYIFESRTEYNGLGAVTEFLHSVEISQTFRGKKPLGKKIKTHNSLKISYLNY
jgi:hypothetical protein